VRAECGGRHVEWWVFLSVCVLHRDCSVEFGEFRLCPDDTFWPAFFKKAGLELDGRGALLLNGIGILLGYFLTLMHRLKSGSLERHVPAS